MKSRDVTRILGLVLAALILSCGSGPRRIPAPDATHDTLATEDTERSDSIEPKACTTADDCAVLAEGNLCLGLACDEGQCVVASSLSVACEPCNVCVPDTGECQPVSDGVLCQDGTACRVGRVCEAGTCQGGVVDCATAECASTSAVCDSPTCGNFSIGCNHTHVYALNASGAASSNTLYPGCLEEEFPGEEVTYEYVAREAGPVTFAISTQESGVNLFLWQGGACTVTQCAQTTAASGELTVEDLEPGDVVHIAVEGTTGAEEYSLQVRCSEEEEACEWYCPNGAECGDNGCGGQCGVCATGSQCVDGACELIPSNDTCESATPITAVPGDYAGHTYAAADDYSLQKDACHIDTTAGVGRDVVYSFVAPETGVYTFELVSGLTDFAALLTVLRSCTDVSSGVDCLAAAVELEAKGGQIVSADLEAGETVFVLVDGMEGATDSALVPTTGNFTLRVDRASCENVVPDYEFHSEQLPFVFPDDVDELDVVSTDGFGSQWSVPEGGWCQNGDTPTNAYGDAPEYVLRYTPDQDETLVLNLTTTGTLFDSTLYVSSCLPGIMARCLAGADVTESAGGESVTVSLTAGLTYFIVVDGIAGSMGTFQLTAETCDKSCEGKECGDDGCGGSCGTCLMGSGCAANQQCLPGGAHGDCSNAATVTSVPYTHYGNTEGGEDNYDPPVTGICDEAAWASFEAAPDEVVRFLAPDSGVYRFKIGPSGTTFNAGLYAVTDCEEIDSSCLASAEGNASDLSDELLLSLASDESAYVIVDGVVTGQGVYQLEITECIASCDGKDCGDDGCGGVCGVCAEGTECSVEKLCVSS